MTAIAGLDIGGTKTCAVLLGSNGELTAVARVPTDASGPDGVYKSAKRALKELASSASVRVFDSLGIGIAGIVDNQKGTVAHAVNLSIGEEPLAIGPLLEDRFQAAVNVENDVNASAFGAFTQMAACESIGDLAYLSIGTGIAAGLVLNGHIYRGKRGIGGEIGHFPAVSDGPECRCGLRGCFEAVASGTAIDRVWPVAEGRNSAPELFSAAQFDEAAARIANEIADHLARAIYLLAIAYDIDVIVVSGGVAEAGPLFYEALDAGLERLGRKSAFVRSLALRSRLRPSPGGPIGAIGAAAAVIDHLALGIIPALAARR